eukprot:9396509-Pyramimonas_sp.AAC.1
MSALRAHSGHFLLGPIWPLISFKGLELLVLPSGSYGSVISMASGGNWALFHYCQYGCACKKPAYLASSPPVINSLERLCPGNHSHEIPGGK